MLLSPLHRGSERLSYSPKVMRDMAMIQIQSVPLKHPPYLCCSSGPCAIRYHGCHRRQSQNFQQGRQVKEGDSKA